MVRNRDLRENTRAPKDKRYRAHLVHVGFSDIVEPGSLALETGLREEDS